nr:DNA damage-inducible protein D [Bacilli bacterium]
MEIELYSSKVFENIKHIEDGVEYWRARELQNVLDYKLWQNFHNVIKSAMSACQTSNYEVSEHFIDINKVLIVGNGASQNIVDYKLSRYACYLIAMNGDPRKKVIALAQTYFAIQTRKQELLESSYKELSEEEKRLLLRDKTKKGNYNINRAAINSGVKNLSKFHNAGYRGLYNGETADDIFKRKKLRYREDILDNMGSEELADNLFRIVQTESKLKNDNIDGEKNSCDAHYKVGKIVRSAIKKSGGTMPEDLPSPKKSLKEFDNTKKTSIR